MPLRRARLGLVLCALYILFYGGFVLIGAFRPEWMDRTPWAGVNLAIWYGFGLIAAAIVLAVIYGVASRDSGTAPAARAPADPADREASR